MNTSRLLLENFCKEQHLPPQYITMAEQWFLPLSAEIADLHSQKHASSKQPLLIGINGCQGSGKSTLSDLLKTLLNTQYQKQVIVLSIDDFYLTKTERQQLAQKIHPLFTTRGVPGTHDIDLLSHTITQLSILSESTLAESIQSEKKPVSIPRFNKATDDRHPKNHWDNVSEPVDIILLEGWCVASPAQEPHLLEQPINTLEKEEDQDKQWRQTSNQLLNTEYKALFDTLDILIMLKAPNFNCVYEWRKVQEDRLREVAKTAPNKNTQGIMNEQQLKRFIEHYQRITEHTLEKLSQTADIVFTLNTEHTITERCNPHA